MVRSFSQLACFMMFVSFCLPISSQGQHIKKPNVLKALSNEANLTRCIGFTGQPLASKEQRILFDRQAKWDASGISNPDQSGLRLRLVKIVDAVAPGGAAPARYRVYAEGAPQDKVFVLNTWLPDNTLKIDPRDLYVNTQGLVMTHKPAPEEEILMKAPGTELDVQAGNQNGEPVRFVLTSRDGTTSIYGSLVEHPLVGDDKGCKVEARISLPGAAAVLITLNGFPGKINVPLVLVSAGAQISEVLETNSDGHAEIAVLTGVPGKTEGTLKATAEGPNCLPSVSLPWKAATEPPAAKTP